MKCVETLIKHSSSKTLWTINKANAVIYEITVFSLKPLSDVFIGATVILIKMRLCLVICSRGLLEFPDFCWYVDLIYYLGDWELHNWYCLYSCQHKALCLFHVWQRPHSASHKPNHMATFKSNLTSTHSTSGRTENLLNHLQVDCFSTQWSVKIEIVMHLNSDRHLSCYLPYPLYWFYKNVLCRMRYHKSENLKNEIPKKLNSY